MLNSNIHHNHSLCSPKFEKLQFFTSSLECISAKTIEKKCNVIAFICSPFPTRARWSMFLAPLPIPNSTTYINHTSCDCPVLWAKKKMYKKFRILIVYRSVPYSGTLLVEKMVNFVLKIL